MLPNKSLDYSKIITTMLYDVQTLHSSVFTKRSCRLTSEKLEKRVAGEGIGFLTKTLPRLGKALDKALAEIEPLDAVKLRFKPLPNSKLPKFLGELFQRILSHNGTVLPAADVQCIKAVRDILFVFYKLEIPHSPRQEEEVIQKFLKTDEDITPYHGYFGYISQNIRRNGARATIFGLKQPLWYKRTIYNARRNLEEVLSGFDERDIYPRHGPGAVSTGERLWDKYRWRNIPSRIAASYPIDEYYYSSVGHVCDALQEINSLGSVEHLAKVILVPKDSRGPRLISCEPLEFQWIQQGLGRALMRKIEQSPYTRWSIRFTDQQPNRLAALVGSSHGRYATLDLKEASDRVSVGLVSLLFPEPLLTALMNTRSLGTKLPDGKEVLLKKFAPMGSALCFPVMALTTWALLYAGLRVFDANVLPEDVYVYGDDVIVPARLAEHAMNILESFGLAINRDKSCTKGLFRESCGLDAFAGIEVTPVRIRTPWTSLRCPEVYTSYIATARKMYERKYYGCYNYIVGRLIDTYGSIPSDAYRLSVPSLPYVPETDRGIRRRYNVALQKHQYLVYDVVPLTKTKELSGWQMLLRYFSEANATYELRRPHHAQMRTSGDSFQNPFSVRRYTVRRRTKLVKKWR